MSVASVTSAKLEDASAVILPCLKRGLFKRFLVCADIILYLGFCFKLIGLNMADLAVVVGEIKP